MKPDSSAAFPASSRLKEDDTARLRALDVASFIVEAPAGAGKTELLTQRYLRLLSVVEHPEEVLALTFTNKAATEMRDRILGSLERAVSGELPEQPHKQQTFHLARAVLAHDHARGWGLLGHPGRLRVTTLDALCASLARQMPYLSRFGAQPGVTDDAEAHYASAARRTLEMVEAGGELAPDAAPDTASDTSPDSEVVAAALAFMDNDAGRLERLLVAMLGRRDQWLQHTSRIESGEMQAEVEAGFARLIERDLAAVVALFGPPWQSRLMPLARFAAAQVPDILGELADWDEPLGADLSDLSRWRALSNLLLTGTGTLRKSLNKNIGFPAGEALKPQKVAMTGFLTDLAGDPEAAAILAQLGQLSGLPNPVFADFEWCTVAVFSRLLRLAAGQLWLVFQEAGEVDFIEIAGRASLALGDDDAPTDLAQALDYRISHLLVDEFQDTSPSQVELIEKLIRGWTPDDGRTLFVVGDPMQSIYRFRKADVGLFLRVREHGIGDIALEHLRLFRNNRSFPAVVDWVNTAFPGIFPALDSPAMGAVRYAESIATRPARDDSSVTIHPLIALADAPEAADQAEARCVLDLILEARRAYPGERIAILVRARSHLDGLVAEIRRSAPGLAFQAVEIEGLDGRQHIQDLLTLFHALHHRADRMHWLALLRAPFCGLTLADLHALAADDRRSTVWQLIQDPVRLSRLSADAQARLAHLSGVLAQAFAQRGRRHPRRWLEGVWLMLSGPQCLDTPEALADVEAFFALVDKLVAGHALTAETLAAKTAELFAPPDPLAGDSVQMMTIHKSKGLEFDTVILPGLQRKTGFNDSQLLLWDQVIGEDGEAHLLVAPIKAKGPAGKEATTYDYLKKLESERTGHELERLLYVAATRAIRQLHLVGSVDANGDQDSEQESDQNRDQERGLTPPPSGTLLNLLWPGLAEPVFVAARAALAAQPQPASSFDQAAYAPPLLRLAKVSMPAGLAPPPVSLTAVENPLDVDTAAHAQSLEAAVGSLIHRCLELIAQQGLSHWSGEKVSTLAPAYRRWLQHAGVSPEDAALGAGVVVSALQTTLNSEAGRWVLADHPEAAAEQAWSSQGEAGVAQHVIDRVFVAGGWRWIIDYKTVHLAAEGLPARAESHRPQLERYARLFAGGDLPVRMAIYFPLQGVLHPLTPE